MGVCQPFGFPAYNPGDLSPEGFISTQIEREYDKGEPPPKARQDSPLPGQSFTEFPNGDILEKRKLLPASSIFYELQYRTVLKSNNETAGQSGGFLGSGLAGGGLIQAVANQIVLGGISVGKTHFSLQQIDAITEINIPIRITSEILDSSYIIKDKETQEEKTIGTIVLSTYPLSVLSVTDDKLFFNQNQRANIGEAGRPKGIGGTTDEKGQFDGNIIDEIFAEYTIEGFSGGPFSSEEVEEILSDNTDISRGNVKIVEESKKESREEFVNKNRFIRISKDPRLLRFRADTDSIEFEKDIFSIPGLENDQELLKNVSRFSPTEAKYGFTITNPENFHDLTSNRIQIDLDGLEEDSVVYLTASLSSLRRLRQNIEAKGTIFEGANRVGIALSEIVAIPEAEAFNFKIVNWKIPKDPNQEKVNILSAFGAAGDEAVDEVSGWRLTELISIDPTDFYIADSRGIVLKRQTGQDEILLAANQIKDQDWFNNYLQNNDLTNRVFDDSFGNNQAGLMFDVSDIVNSALYDQEKLPYHRPFALAISQVSQNGIGIPNLDLVRLGIGSPNNTDLSSAIFIDGKQRSVFPSSFSGETCTSTKNFGSIRDPNFPASNFSVFIPQPAADVQTDWNISSPIFTDDYSQMSRLYIERFAPDRTDEITRRMSLVFVSPIAGSESSLSLDSSYDKENTFVFFESDTTDSIAYHKLTNSDTIEQIKRLSLFKNGSHEREEFNHDSHDIVGYNFLIGDNPSYSDGIIPSTEFLDICSEKITKADLFEKKIFTVDGSEKIKEINIDEDFLIRDIVIKYKILDVSESDSRISFQFGKNGLVINNSFLPIEKEEPGQIKKFIIDGRLYSGSPLIIQSNAFEKSIQVISIDIIGSRKEKIDEFKIKGTQTATAIDGRNRLFVFYHDTDTKNISVAASSVGGSIVNKWFINKDIIRLVEGEVADIPYIISDKELNLFYLFYRLNNQFLMVKTIDPELITCEDVGLEYSPPPVYTDSSDENIGLEEYSDKGKALRKGVSYFVVGDATDTFFKSELETTRQRINNAKENGTNISNRFSFRGIESQMDVGFSNGSFCAYKDSKGTYRVFFVLDDGRMYSRRSSNLIEWIYDFKKAVFHKDFQEDTIENSELSISNPQVIYDDLKEFVHILYFYLNGLYMRTFSNNSLFPESLDLNLTISGEGDSRFTAENIRKEIELNKDNLSPPIFLVGQITEEILRASEESDIDNPLLLRITYIEDIKNRFVSDDFSVDIEVKTAGFVLKNGLLRVIYKVPTGEIYGIIINANRLTLDVLLRETGI